MLFLVKKITDRSSTASTGSCSAFGKRPRTMGATLRRVSSAGSSMGTIRGGFNASPTNSLISHFRKKPSKLQIA